MKSKVGLVLIFALFIGNLSVFGQVLAAVHSAGTNVSNNGTIYMVTDNGQRRPYTSAGAFLSYGFNSWSTVVPASAEDMALPEGSFIPPRDGKIVCSDRGTDKGTCYLITNSKRAAFISAKIFTDLGFSFSKALYGDVSFLEKDSDISGSGDQHRAGVLINKNGTIYLVTATGLQGIPSLEVLKTWGYTFDDAVKANSSDSSLAQSAVIAKREGAALSPNGEPSSAISEDSLYQAYIDTYPDLPTKTISAPQDGAQVVDLFKKINALPSMVDTYPYMTAQSLEMLNKLPSLKSYVESENTFVAGLQYFSSKIDVYEGGTQAMYTETDIQPQTSHMEDYYYVAKKEGGVWKMDLVGSFKQTAKVAKLANPTNAYTTGSGTDDIAVTDAYYPDEAYINDNNTRLLLLVKNNGTTSIHKFSLLVYFNNIIVVDEVLSYNLEPGQQIYLAVPISRYWALDAVRKTAGSYSTDIRLGLSRNTNEVEITNNKYTRTASFSVKPTSSIPNIIGY